MYSKYWDLRYLWVEPLVAWFEDTDDMLVEGSTDVLYLWKLMDT